MHSAVIKSAFGAIGMLDEKEDDIGIFDFAKRTAVLFVPMAAIAGFFAFWMDAKIAGVREAIAGAISAHMEAEGKTYVTKTEFTLLKQILDERYAQDRKDAEAQFKNIQKNTLFLERISQKLGIQRPPE